MTSNQILQLRQILKEIHKWTIEESGIVCPHKFGICKHDNKKCPVYLIEEALALLPCPTCNGTGQVPDDFDDCGGVAGACVEIMHMNGELTKPCPDCQS